MKVYFKWLFIQLIIAIPYVFLLFFIMRVSGDNYYTAIPIILLLIWVGIKYIYIPIQFYAEKKGWKRHRSLYFTDEELRAMGKLKYFPKHDLSEKELERAKMLSQLKSWEENPETLADDLERVMKKRKKK